ncbi:uncharacterized protein LOC124314384 [Daphnia pulicaria]|uniref:uncharacterized protein LOC124314384 n=1 Tax=Daphnia pulicaria TaxID=35523 RepID=UPI001EEA2F4E|nr:uncharacterized protein LOC124314384 [Daphnia pulicaria]XP_046635461.1 uncharacterized protein LOC124314384 [Daphnia pulicaria]
MGFITDVVIQLALFLVFTINCENTTGIGHPLDPVLNVTTECITYRYVLCPKNMTAMTVIFEYEKMDDPYSSISKDSQCIFYRFIPCREASPDLILEQERHRQTKSINGKEQKNFEEKKNLELSALENKLNCLTSQITQCEISQIISKENMKQLNVTENEKFVLQRDINNLTDKIKQSETSRQRSDEHLILCKKLAYNLTLKSAECGMEIEGKKAAENIVTEAQVAKKQLIDDKTKLMYSSIAKNFNSTPFSGKLGVQSYTLYQMGRMKIIPKLHIVPLVAQYGIVFNDVASISYNLTIPPCKQSAESLADSSRSVFIAVVSAPGNRERRETIRQTWKRHAQLVLGITIEFAFVLGPTDDDQTQNRVKEESTINEDIIQISDMPAEFPSNMTMPGVLNWIYYHCPQTEFLFKVEDDMYVNVHKLAYFVRDFYKFGNNGTLAIYSQMVDENIDGQKIKPKPKRSGEKMVSLDDWPWNTYPYYFDGPAYLMHKSTIFPLLAAIQTTPVYSFEDVYITGICGDKVGLNRRISGKSLPVLWPRASETVTNTCDVHKFLSWKNTDSSISHEKIDAFYSGRAPNSPCDYNYKDSHNFTFFRLD